MAPEPLSQSEVEALLHHDPQTRKADLLVLRDALDRMADALEALGSAVGDLRHPRRRGEPPDRRHLPPRAD